MMQGIWKDMPHPFFRLQRKSIRMQRKLFLYWLSMLLVIFSIFLVVLHIAGVFSALDKEMNQLLSTRQKNIMTDLSYQLGKMTAQGISVSEQSSAILSNALFTDPITSLHDQPERIGELESLLYGHLTTALRSTPCSGAYLVLDATTNTQAPGAQNSRAGLYLRLANMSSKGAANQDIVFYRGVAEVAREHQLELHNRWKLEFDISNLPGYDAMLDLPPERLAESAVWTPRICLPGTWENVMILMVPIRGNDGTVMGVCGLELSELYFMLSYPSEQSNLGSMVTLLAPINGDSLPLSQAMTGRLGDTYLDTEDTLQIKEGKYFNQYIGDSQTFLGVHTPAGGLLPFAGRALLVPQKRRGVHPFAGSHGAERRGIVQGRGHGQLGRRRAARLRRRQPGSHNGAHARGGLGPGERGHDSRVRVAAVGRGVAGLHAHPPVGRVRLVRRGGPGHAHPLGGPSGAAA